MFQASLSCFLSGEGNESRDGLFEFLEVVLEGILQALLSSFNLIYFAFCNIISPIPEQCNHFSVVKCKVE